MGLRNLVWAAPALMVLAGCGGVSAGERRAAERAWSAAADRRCERAASFVVSTPQPETVRGLRWYANHVTGYTRDGIADVARTPVPRGAEGRAVQVSAVLLTLLPRLRELEAAGRIGDRRGQAAAAVALRVRWRDIEPALEAAGLHACSGARQGVTIADAVLAPLWVQRFTELHERANRRALAVWSASTGGSFAARVRRTAGITDRLADRIDALEAPGSISGTGYVDLLLAMADAERDLADRAGEHDGRGVVHAARVLWRATRRALAEYDRLGYGTGHWAVPTVPKRSLQA